MPDDGRRYGAFLFDMDGTILTSIAAAERVWTLWANDHGVDPAVLLPTIHGIRAIDIIRRLDIPGVDAEREARAIADAEIIDVAGIVPVPDAGRFLGSLPPGNWGVVTSAPRALAVARLAAAGLPMPPLIVTADDVARGKPAPDPFLLGAERLGVSPRDCLVFEDAPAGIAAAEAASMSLVIVTLTHAAPMITPHPTIRHYEGLVCVRDQGGLHIARAGTRPDMKS